MSSPGDTGGAGSAHPASFRDPSGFLFERDGRLFRQVHASFGPHYDRLIESGLFRRLVETGRLVSHEEVNVAPLSDAPSHRILEPERLPFISYPYEWCPGQLREAALATLDIAAIALEHGMCLKDASAFNVQFRRGRPVFVDTLSFENHQDGAPWPAYRQFVEHFLAPLALAVLVHPGCLRLFSPTGISLDLARRLLPAGSWFRFGLLLHVHLHALAGGASASAGNRRPGGRMEKRALIALLDSLASAVRSLTIRSPRGHWSTYYDERVSYSEKGFDGKVRTVGAWLDAWPRGLLLDVGGNVGRFGIDAARRGYRVVSLESDPWCVERAHAAASAEPGLDHLALVVDLLDPTPPRGFRLSERSSVLRRGAADVLLALGLIHHLAYGGQVPIRMVVDQLADLAPRAIVEFIPPDDPMVLSTFPDASVDRHPYTRELFEKALADRYRTIESEPIPESGRVLFRVERDTSRPS